MWIRNKQMIRFVLWTYRLRFGPFDEQAAMNLAADEDIYLREAILIVQGKMN